LKATQFQQYVQKRIAREDKPSMLLIAPTGLGKTFAVTRDLQSNYTKIIYAVPLRALGNDICRSIGEYRRDGRSIQPVVHHGAVQESTLFGEEVMVTTYDQVVCGVPGLPLSLPLKAGHAVAGALLMSRLVLDEAHLAWGISANALAILLAIAQFRARYGLQTILQTATLPDAISELLARELGLELVRVGRDGEVPEDEALTLRDENRQVKPERLSLKKLKGDKGLDYGPLDDLLTETGGHNRIYFANTVDRIQETYDRLMAADVPVERIIVLHNRMPHEWRARVEQRVRADFGEMGEPQGLILLTNQVAEAGLNISAPLAVSDPAPVDTLVQRAGRCARWFRKGKAEGRFIAVNVPGMKEKGPSDEAKEYAAPYRVQLVAPAVQHFPDQEATLSWDVERQWVNKAWGGGEDKARAAVERSLNDTAFALNLFDRAAQERQPGQIARVFRDILSVEVAVEEGDRVITFADDVFAPKRDLPGLLAGGQRPDTSSISLGKAIELVGKAGGRAAIIRYEDDELKIRSADSVQVGDVLILPSTMAYLHRKKGLCFGDGRAVRDVDVVLQSDWRLPSRAEKEFERGTERRQTLAEHTRNVMGYTYAKLTSSRPYRDALINILKTLEQPDDVERLACLVAQISCVAVAFHDLGKADSRWQKRVRELDPGCPLGLVGRSLSAGQRIGIPHTPPGYVATVEACRLLFGGTLGNAEPLVRAIALAACRHHSSLFHPATIQNYSFTPHPDATEFVRTMLSEVGAPPTVVAQAPKVLAAAQTLPAAEDVPLLLPNHDLFPLYALVGRAILLADREDAADMPLEQLP
jgi:CRISPR-associated endonuclease/helicase Cas3